MKIPNTPFSTRLSGSAKETELRLRSIFQWKKKRPPVMLVVLIAVLLLGICGGLVSCEPAEVPEDLLNNIEQWTADYPWNEHSEKVNQDTRWVVETVERTDRRYITEGTRAAIYEVKSRSESGASELTLTLLVNPDTLEIYPEPESWTISGKEELPQADAEVVAPIDGESLSPDGMYEVRLSGVIEGVSTDGLAAAELVQICDTRTGEVLWQGDGAYEHAVIWSPDGKKLALARTTRTGSTVTIVETEQWTAWDVTIPGTDYWNQVPISEYTYLPDNGDWLNWVNTSEFRLTLGRGGDAGEKTDYHVILSEGVPLNGSALFMEAELLSTEYDLDHDGSPERLERMFVRESEDGPVSFFKLHVLGNDDILLWSGEAHTAHAGWNTYFVCTLDGRDYLLEYDPYMSGGVCYYSYRLFSLGHDGEEVLFKENMLDFDINPASKVMNHNFNANAIADFVDEVNELLAHSKLLLTTDDAVRDMDPDAPTETLWWLEYPYGYDESKSLREKLKDMERYLLTI